MTDLTEEEIRTANQRIRDLTRIREQADRYMKAVYGPSYFYRAPEAYENLVERWILSLAAGRIDAAEVIMFDIEGMAKESKHA